jgi:hypothetical protein
MTYCDSKSETVHDILSLFEEKLRLRKRVG